MVKNQVTLKVAGVTFGNRQEAIKRLCNYAPRRIVFTIRREHENRFDPNAIAIDVTVIGKGTLHIGYFPKGIAQILAPILDRNLQPTIKNWEIIGEDTRGIKLTLELVEGITISSENSMSAYQNSALIAIR